MFFKVVCAVILAVGIFLVVADLFKIPTIKASMAVKSLASRQKHTDSSLEIWLRGLAEWLSKHIRLNEYRRAQLESDLKVADMKTTPEMYVADAIVKAGIIGCLVVPFLFIFPFAVPIILLIAFIFYRI